MKSPRRFVFRGNASGVCAHIRRPENRVLPVQAASSLGVNGGLSESKAGPQSLGDYLHFLYAETSAHGDFVDPKEALAITLGQLAPDAAATQTTVTAKVRGLNVGKRLLIDLAQTGLVSTSPAHGSKQPSIRLVGNQLQGVVVDGHSLKITLNDELFCTCDTLEKLEAAHASGLSESQQNMFYCPPGAPSKQLYVSGGSALATVVQSMEWVNGKPEGIQEAGVNAFYLPGFGWFHFGELLITALSRRLTMVRFQLGSPVGGGGTAVESETNGSNWPEVD